MQLRFSVLRFIVCAALSPAIAWSATTVSVSISPGSTTVGLAQTLQYKATVTGETSQVVKWYVNGVESGNSTVGTISTSGSYKALAKLPSGSKTMTITAVTADSKAKGTALATLAPVGPAISSITPNPLTPGTYTATI